MLVFHFLLYLYMRRSCKPIEQHIAHTSQGSSHNNFENMKTRFLYIMSRSLIIFTSNVRFESLWTILFLSCACKYSDAIRITAGRVKVSLCADSDGRIKMYPLAGEYAHRRHPLFIIFIYGPLHIYTQSASHTQTIKIIFKQTLYDEFAPSKLSRVLYAARLCACFALRSACSHSAG